MWMITSTRSVTLKGGGRWKGSTNPKRTTVKVVQGAHSHKEVEETFYFFDGSPKMVINDEVFQTREGDAFRVEPREKHDVVNDTDRAVKVVFIKSPYLPEDKISYQRA